MYLYIHNVFILDTILGTEIYNDDIDLEPEVVTYYPINSPPAEFAETTTGASAAASSSQPVTSAASTSGGSIPLLILDTETEVGKVAPAAADNAVGTGEEVRSEAGTEFEFTTTGSPLSASGSSSSGGVDYLDVEPVVADEADDGGVGGIFADEGGVLVEIDSGAVVEFDQTTTGSPLDNNRNSNNDNYNNDYLDIAFAVEPVVAEEDQDEDYSFGPSVVGLGDFINDVVVEFSETTTGSPNDAALPKINENSHDLDDSAYGLLDVTPILHDHEETTTNASSGIIDESNDDRIVFPDSENDNLDVFNETDATTTPTATNDDGYDKVIFNFEDKDDATKMMTDPSQVYQDEYTTIRVVVDPNIRMTTSREIVSITEFVKKYQTTVQALLGDTTTSANTANEGTSASEDDNVDATTIDTIERTVVESTTTENNRKEGDNTIDAVTQSESASTTTITDGVMEDTTTELPRVDINTATDKDNEATSTTSSVEEMDSVTTTYRPKIQQSEIHEVIYV